MKSWKDSNRTCNMEVEKLFCRFCLSETENEDQICNYCKSFDWKEGELERFSFFIKFLFDKPLNEGELLVINGLVEYYKTKSIEKQKMIYFYPEHIKKIINKPDWENIRLGRYLAIFVKKGLIFKKCINGISPNYRLNLNHNYIKELLAS